MNTAAHFPAVGLIVGPELDFLVARFEGVPVHRYAPGSHVEWIGTYLRNGVPVPKDARGAAFGRYEPSTNPLQGHPIIERESIIFPRCIQAEGIKEWFAVPLKSPRCAQHGATMLIAGMRAFIACRMVALATGAPE